MLTLHSNVLGTEFSSFYKLRERLSDWSLGSNWVGGNNLDTAEFCSLGCSAVAIQYLYICSSIYRFVYQNLSTVLVRKGLRFIYHGYGLRRAYLSTYAASFTVVQIYLDGDGFADDSIRAIQPA